MKSYLLLLLFWISPVGMSKEIARDNGQKKGLWHQTLDEEYLEKRFVAEVLNPEPANVMP